MNDAILITGGSGLLAVNAAITLRQRYPVLLGLHTRNVALARVHSKKLGLESVAGLTSFLISERPSLVIHTAGLTSVEKCEANPQMAHHVNVTLAENVAIACGKCSVPLVHISTDHLFKGDTAFLDEGSAVNPLNIYGRTKAEAEIKVLAACPDALVVRTNFYCWGTSYRRSFSDVVIDTLRSGTGITLFRDVFITPLHAEQLVEAILELISKKASGIINVVGETRLSKWELGVRLADTFGLDKGLIKSGSLDEHSGLTLRPKDMSLSNLKCSKLLGHKLGDIETQISRLYQQEREGIMKEIGAL